MVTESHRIANFGKATQLFGHPTTDRIDLRGLHGFINQLRQLKERKRPVQSPLAIAQHLDARFFLVELILNLTHQFFEDVLQGHHAGGTAVFIHHHRQMKATVQKELQQPV